ncbi:hypothetical protein Acr_02g0002950 [Actinidia rufa]|uniref:Ribosome biogenesis protein NOP53 n=1 Tax=Actinidia rufa TaxID=165716 RepID=A0A7J0E6S6_9ERIC|nr:hypothetical protein Acr_02g0002950 [Actinidia rufa]
MEWIKPYRISQPLLNLLHQTQKDSVQGPPKEDGVSDSGMVDIWNDKGENTGKTKKKSKPSIIPAVEVEPPGCSFNPSFESHQDSLACAVADEMQKIYRHELGPKPVPLTVPGEVVDEEDVYFLEADNESEDDDQSIENQNGDEHEKRFDPAPVQVLLSEEITGSLRKLKVYPFLSHIPNMFSEQLSVQF